MELIKHIGYTLKKIGPMNPSSIKKILDSIVKGFKKNKTKRKYPSAHSEA